MKLLRPLAGYTLCDHKTKDYVRRGLHITGILDKIDEYRRNWFQHIECHKTESLSNHTTTDHKEEEQLEDRRSVGASSYNSGDGTDQRVQSLMFIMMMMIMMMIYCIFASFPTIIAKHPCVVTSVVMINGPAFHRWGCVDISCSVDVSEERAALRPPTFRDPPFSLACSQGHVPSSFLLKSGNIFVSLPTHPTP